jgi:hypothetical protein
MLTLADHLTLGAPDWARAIHGPVGPAEWRATPAEGSDAVDLKTTHALVEGLRTTPMAS